MSDSVPPQDETPELAKSPKPVATSVPISHAGISMRTAWRQDRLKLAGWLIFGTLVGAMFSRPVAGLAIVLAFQLIAALRNMRALLLWLDAPKRYDLPDVGGVWGAIFENLIDIQRRNRKRKKKLAAILAEFQASTAALPDGAVVLAERGEIAWFNKSAQILLGLRASHDLGIRIVNLIRHPDFSRYMKDALYDGEVEVPSPINERVTLSLRIIPYGNNQRLLIVRDVSEIRRLETARRDFVSNASHELRTPLTVMRGYLDMIEPDSRGQGPLSPWRLPIDEMRSQATRMEGLIGDMLKLARLESEGQEPRMEPVDVPELLRRTLEEGKALSKGHHHFETDVDERLLLVGRESELASIFINLVSNAVRYTADQGTIRLRWWQDVDGAHFSVTDSGIGISPEDIPRLTERFYRVDVGRSRASGGTGLGLSIVKHALERHEARLQIDSRLGIGSTFSCHFPLQRVQQRGAFAPLKAVALRH